MAEPHDTAQLWLNSYGRSPPYIIYFTVTFLPDYTPICAPELNCLHGIDLHLQLKCCIDLRDTDCRTNHIYVRHISASIRHAQLDHPIPGLVISSGPMRRGVDWWEPMKAKNQLQMVM